WKIKVARGGVERIVHVVDGMREGVRTLDLQSVREALLDVHLQAVIDGIANGLRESRAGESSAVVERIVVSGVEGKSAVKAASKPEVAELEGLGAAAERVVWVGTVLEQTRHQRRLRWIGVHHPQDVRA